jgi:hypothetical protein
MSAYPVSDPSGLSDAVAGKKGDELSARYLNACIPRCAGHQPFIEIENGNTRKPRTYRFCGRVPTGSDDDHFEWVVNLLREHRVQRLTDRICISVGDDDHR